MADEVNVAFGLGGAPEASLAAWKRDPPSFLGDAGYRLVDESYDTLVYEANVTTTSMKIVMFGFAKTIYKLLVTFTSREPGEQHATRVTISGQAKDGARDRLGGFIREHGTPL